jgi:trans-2,3-dihydro-3-hydroxyanthranilate isomerase
MPDQVSTGRPRPFLHYDVFTDQPLTGNQLAVFTDAEGLEAATMQRMAREMNFPESTFMLPAEWAGTDARMRIFTPAVELPIAGHPTIGSTFALAELGIIQPGTSRAVFQLNIGPTPVDLEWEGDRLSFVWMTQPNPVFGPVVENRMLVAGALGLVPEDLLAAAPVQEVSCGVPFLYVALRDPQAVDRAVSDAAAFRRLAKSTGFDLPIFLFAVDGGAELVSSARASLTRLASQTSVVRATDNSAVNVYSRMFAPEFGITEDPATGIASGPLAAYLVHHGLVALGGQPGDEQRDTTVSVVSRQGVAMGRPSRIHISIRVVDDVISDVKVGGEAVLVARGEFLV